MNITVRQIEFKSSNGQNTIFGWIYIPGDEARGIVQISHGMAEHMGRYHEFMRFLAQNGYAACGIDHLGHGRSTDEEHLGYFAEKDGYKRLVEDQHKFNKIVRSELPGLKCILFGHSMGSFIARMYAARYPQTLGGLILMGTGRVGTMKADFAVRMARRSIKRNGPFYRDRDLEKLVFGSYNDRFAPNGTGREWLSRDAESVRLVREDKKSNFIFTASGFRDLFLLVSGANEQKCFASVPAQLPIFILSGSMDPVGDYGKGPAQIYDRYVKAGVSDVELVLYEGARHELLNESNRGQVCGELLGWLNKHCEPQPEELELPMEDEPL